MATVLEAGVMVKLGASPTVTATVVEAVRVPDMPLMVTVVVAAAAVAVALKVTVLVPVVGFVP